MKRTTIATGLVLSGVFSSCFADYDKVRSEGAAGDANMDAAGTSGANTAGSNSGGLNAAASGGRTQDAIGTGGALTALVGGTSNTTGAGGTANVTSGGTSNSTQGTCGLRNCTSSLDNDCANGPDAQEFAFCQCSGSTQECATGNPGACATGTKTCVYSEDRSLSAWGACVAPTPRLRNCRSNADSNCDGTPDDDEASCGGCNGPALSCALEQHGIGACSAGTPTQVYSADGSTCSWQCVGRQEPTNLEGCGPLTAGGAPTPDSNCDTVAGNGPGCGIEILRIYVDQSRSGSCSCSGPSWSYSSYKATLKGSPGSGWSEFSQFKVFTGTQPRGTVPVLNCTDGSQSYVIVGTTCPGASAPLGYVSTTKAAGYDPLNQAKVNVTSCTSTHVEYVPVGKEKTGSNITASTYYTVPLSK